MERTSEAFVPRPTGEEEIPARVADEEEIPARLADEEQIPARVDFPEEEIPAWMDFPAEEGESDSSEDKRRRAICIAWMIARKEILKSRLHTSRDWELQEENRKVAERRREEVRRVWEELSAKEESRAVWKVSEKKLLSKLTFLIWGKKVVEIEESYTLKLQLKEAQEKGLWPDVELKENYKNYLAFRNMWIATHSRWGCAFEDITTIRSMGYTDQPAPQYVYNHGPPDTLQILSIEIGGTSDGELCWPIHVFGLVAVRDSVDQQRNLVFDRDRYECQTLTKEDPYLVLTGPTRAVVMNDETIPVTIEAELKVRGTDDGSTDKCLIFAAAPLPSEFGSCLFELTDGKYSKLKIALGRIMACVEATIFVRVIRGTWPAGFRGQIAAHTSTINPEKVVLVEFVDGVPVSDGIVDQSRFVVSVEAFGELMVSYKAWRGDEVMEGKVAFKPEKKGRSYGTLKVGACVLEVIVAWSPIRPVCEEVVSMSEMEFLGDAVLEYLMISYLYSAYPDLKPGQLTDLKSLAVNNNSFAYVAVKKSMHKYLIKDSKYLTAAVNKFENYVNLSNSEKDLSEGPACPKVLGDIVESCVGAVLLDSGFNLNHAWKLMLMLLKPILSFSDMHMNPMRELRELCQCSGFELGLPKPIKVDGEFHVKVEVNVNGEMISCTAANRNSKDARKLAAQDTLSKLKNYGYKHKSKSLEEILSAATKKEPELIGYDEEPINVDGVPLEPKNLQMNGEMEENIFFGNNEAVFIGKSKTSIQRTGEDNKVDKNDANNGKINKSNVVTQNGCPTRGEAGKTSKNAYHGDMVQKTARSFLYELCAANYWKPPEFELCKDEGPSHLRKFTCKVLVQIMGPSATLLECYSDPKQQKKAAQEHAAQGALWCLKQLGYLPKDETRV